MSEELNHTPGPWSIRQEGVWSVGTDHEMTALVYGFTDEEEEANAHVIAAAPDLLEALKILAKLGESHGAEGVYWDKARAAIAKAEGRAN